MSDSLYVVAGLGNPGRKYDKTRHNVGFKIVDYIAGRYDVSLTSEKWSSYYAKVKTGSSQIIIVKPDTYMNLSGRAIRKVLDYFKCPPECLLVIHDDIDMKFGRLKLVGKGGAGGHNGIRSITQELGTDRYYRLKIGVGRPEKEEKSENIPVDKYVLSKFLDWEMEYIYEISSDIEVGLKKWIEKDVSGAQVTLNSIKGQP